jgi:hypothetical protein
MMHLTFAEKSLLVGDTTGRMTVEYAAALARAGDADTVTLTAYGSDGDKVEALLLLDQGAPLMGESTHSDLPEPDNGDAEVYMQEQLARLASPKDAAPVAQDEVVAGFEQQFDDELGGR